MFELSKDEIKFYIMAESEQQDIQSKGNLTVSVSISKNKAS